MTIDQGSLVATASAALAVYLTVPAARMHGSVTGRRVGSAKPNGARARLAVLLAPVDGAPTAFSRAALALMVGVIVLRLASGTLQSQLVAAPAAALATFVALGRWTSPSTRSGKRERMAQLPSVCTSLAVCLEAGLPLRNAVTAVADGAVGPIADSLRRLDASVRLGIPEDEAWMELAHAEPGFAGLGRELALARANGMALAPVLRQHAEEARRGASGAATARARRAGVSSVLPLMTCFLPAFILIGVVPIVGGVATRIFP